MRKDLSVRIWWMAAWVLLAVPLLVRLGVLISASTAGLRDAADFIFDDGYYYLRIAANMADVGRSTFDGITATNGYQPLWMLVLTALAKIVGTNPRTFFVAGCALIYAIACATPLLSMAWWRAPARATSLFIATGLAIVIIQQPIVFLQGLEPILFAPLGMVLVILIERGDVGRKDLLRLSLVLAAIFLVRLDSLALYVSMIVCVPLWDILAGRLARADFAKRAVEIAVRLAVFVLPTVAAYLAINQWLFGSPVPVSGLAKLIGGAQFSNWGATAIFFASKKSFAVLIAIVVVLEYVVRSRVCRPEPLFYRSALVLFVAILAQVFYYAAFSAWYVWPWYTYLVALLMALVIARMVYLCSLLYAEKGPRLVAAGALILLAIWSVNNSLAFTLSSLSPEARRTLAFWKSPQSRAALADDVPSFNQISMDMLNEFFPKGHHTTIAMGDRAGGLAYWGRENVAVIQTEGLTLDVGYLKARKANAGAQYLAQFPIEFLVVDREVVPTVADGAGRKQYVVPEPIQGRINKSAVPTFCFPMDAVRYQKIYPSIYGVNARTAFAFADREPCFAQSLALMQSVENGIGLRQFSLPGEYDPKEGGILDRRIEDRDRHFHGDASPR